MTTTRSLPSVPLVVVVLMCAVLVPLIGWIDRNATEVQPAVLLLLVCSAVLGFLAPRHAWLTALLLGTSILVTHVVARAMVLSTPSDTAGPTLLALIPASIGAVAGAATRLLVGRATQA